MREPGATLATVFEEQRKQQDREIGTSALRDNHFMLGGIQGQRRFLVRAEVRDLEIRGITVLYDRAIEGTSDYVSQGVLSAFAPFPGTGVMALIGLGSGVGQYLWTQAFRFAPAAVAAPFTYTAMIWAMLLGFSIWGDVPTSALLVGAIVVAASGLYILYRETARRRAAQPTAQPASEIRAAGGDD